jgi:hypothetical protein
MVNCSMDRIDFDSRGNVEPGLLETKRHSAGPGEQVNSYWSSVHSENSLCAF